MFFVCGEGDVVYVWIVVVGCGGVVYGGFVVYLCCIDGVFVVLDVFCYVEVEVLVVVYCVWYVGGDLVEVVEVYEFVGGV